MAELSSPPPLVLAGFSIRPLVVLPPVPRQVPTDPQVGAGACVVGRPELSLGSCTRSSVLLLFLSHARTHKPHQGLARASLAGLCDAHAPTPRVDLLHSAPGRGAPSSHRVRCR